MARLKAMPSGLYTVWYHRGCLRLLLSPLIDSAITYSRTGNSSLVLSLSKDVGGIIRNRKV